MQEILEYIQKEWAVISVAPVTFAILAVLMFGLAYWCFKERLSSAKDIIKMREQKVADYEAKTGASSPEEAEARIAQLEERLNGIKVAGYEKGKGMTISDWNG